MNMCIFVYKYIYTYMYTRTYIYIHLPLYTYIYQYIFVYKSIYIWRVGSAVKHDKYVHIYIYIRIQVHPPRCKQESNLEDSLRTNPTRSSRNEQSHCAVSCWVSPCMTHHRIFVHPSSALYTYNSEHFCNGWLGMSEETFPVLYHACTHDTAKCR